MNTFRELKCRIATCTVFLAMAVVHVYVRLRSHTVGTEVEARMTIESATSPFGTPNEYAGRILAHLWVQDQAFSRWEHRDVTHVFGWLNVFGLAAYILRYLRMVRQHKAVAA